ncbi:dTDP-4-dehydrorhamnose reductase [Methanobacterium sp. CWC-01]|uniref:dTDP-4-dehydrorhamnose reductase n=1 Tax=Methanobacterium aridiramus TaxID=2584467 RepID=UPI00257503E5|nr:dTDP-4-dehydrorhamnose reductase [Methanobacterium sp. CWC-01]WJI10320.1 dTDP-4-dehydrorhamnose reductase [Methanobacterium sp. CWC-01]
MKVLIIGAEGMLGHDLEAVLGVEHEISTTTIHTLDITDLEKTVKTIGEINPQVVVHAAAFTDVDGSEERADLAYQVNVLGTRNVAVACQKTDSALVYISTDYVFDGTKDGSYQEYDQTNPLGMYGKTKYLGEVQVRDLLDQFYIVRTSWLYGYHGPNFVATMLGLAEKLDQIQVVSDQIGSPTYTVDLAQAINQLIKTPAYGIYHVTNSDHCSWYQYAQLIFQMKGVEVELVPVTTEEFGSPAPRPKYSVLDNYHWRMQGHPPLRSYKEALKDYLELLE